MREAKKKLERNFFARRRGDPFREGDSHAKIRRKPPRILFSSSASDILRAHIFLLWFWFSYSSEEVERSNSSAYPSSGTIFRRRFVTFERGRSVPRAIRLSVDSKSRNAFERVSTNVPSLVTIERSVPVSVGVQRISIELRHKDRVIDRGMTLKLPVAISCENEERIDSVPRPRFFYFNPVSVLSVAPIDDYL